MITDPLAEVEVNGRRIMGQQVEIETCDLEVKDAIRAVPITETLGAGQIHGQKTPDIAYQERQKMLFGNPLNRSRTLMHDHSLNCDLMRIFMHVRNRYEMNSDTTIMIGQLHNAGAVHCISSPNPIMQSTLWIRESRSVGRACAGTNIVVVLAC
jgi:hypothetical protein